MLAALRTSVLGLIYKKSASSPRPYCAGSYKYSSFYALAYGLGKHLPETTSQ